LDELAVCNNSSNLYLHNLQYTPSLQHHEPALDYIINNFRDYKQKVPTFGAILLNADMNKVVLVQGFGNSWGFPKGKVNQDEDGLICAIREVQEETGYDVENLIRANHFIESLARDRKDRLYIVVGVDMEYIFKPHTAYEIKQIAWFGIEELPDNKRDNVVSSRGISNSNFFTIYPYVRRLKKWIADKVNGANKLQNYTCVGPTQCQFPFPYPMGFRGSRQFYPAPLVPGQFMPQAQASPQGVQPPLRFVDWTPKNDIRNIGFGVPIPPQLNPEMSIHPITSTTRNPKRRLFAEDLERELINSTEPSTSDPTDYDFFSGRGAKAWLNFKLDVSEIMSSFSVC